MDTTKYCPRLPHVDKTSPWCSILDIQYSSKIEQIVLNNVDNVFPHSFLPWTELRPEGPKADKLRLISIFLSCDFVVVSKKSGQNSSKSLVKTVRKVWSKQFKFDESCTVKWAYFIFSFFNSFLQTFAIY